jgi:hypothetical protein
MSQPLQKIYGNGSSLSNGIFGRNRKWHSTCGAMLLVVTTTLHLFNIILVLALPVVHNFTLLVLTYDTKSHTLATVIHFKGISQTLCCPCGVYDETITE